MFGKKKLFALLAGAAAVLLLLALGKVWADEKKKNDLWEHAAQVLADYPALAETYESTACYCRIGDVQYFFLQSDGLTVTGKRDAEGITEYYSEGFVWRTAGDGYVRQKRAEQDGIAPVIGDTVAALLADQTVDCRYKKPAGRDLPLWVYPTDPDYLLIQRPGFEGYIETMICAEGEKGRFIRWSIAQSTENVELYLFAAEWPVLAEELFLPGWGRIPNAVFCGGC